jgi:hypothetical protein
LDSFYISHLKEWDEFIQVIEKGLFLDKANFSEKGYKIDERKFPHNPNKAALSSGKGKNKIDDLIILSNDKREDMMMDEDDAVHLEEVMFEKRKEEEELEEHEIENRNSLEGCQLGGARVGEEYNTDFAKFEGTPQILFPPEGASSEPALMPLRRGNRPTPSSQEFSPLLPSNPLKRRKGTGATIEPGKCMIRCLTMCDIVQFSEMMCIRRSFKKELLHFFMPFDL